jgi:hypothetical protein
MPPILLSPQELNSPRLEMFRLQTQTARDASGAGIRCGLTRSPQHQKHWPLACLKGARNDHSKSLHAYRIIVSRTRTPR